MKRFSLVSCKALVQNWQVSKCVFSKDYQPMHQLIIVPLTTRSLKSFTFPKRLLICFCKMHYVNPLPQTDSKSGKAYKIGSERLLETDVQDKSWRHMVPETLFDIRILTLFEFYTNQPNTNIFASYIHSCMNLSQKHTVQCQRYAKKVAVMLCSESWCPWIKLKSS